MNRSELEELAEGIDEATEKLAKVDQVEGIAKSILDKLAEMVGSAQMLETVLRFSPNDPE
jgi:hypothetical protein